MKLHIEDFNICSSGADHDLIFNEEFRRAVTLAINYQAEEYEFLTDEELDSSKLTLYFYFNNDECLLEIKDREVNPTICLRDNITSWMEVVREES